MTKEEMLKEFREKYACCAHPQNGIDFLSNALDRYFLAMLEQSLPKKIPETAVNLDAQNFDLGFNQCRAEVLVNALRIVGGGENEEKG